MKEKICHISTVHPAIDARILDRECSSLIKFGYEVHLFAHGRIEKNFSKLHFHPIRDFPNRLSRFLASSSIVNSLLKLHPQIIHFHDSELIPTMLKINKKHRNIKIIFDCHEDTISHISQKEHIPEIMKPIMKKITKHYFKCAARNFDAIITADEGTSKLFSNWCAEPVTIYNYPPSALYSNGKYIPFEDRPYDLIYPGSLPRYHLETIFNIAHKLKNIGMMTKWLILANIDFTDSGNWIKHQLDKFDLQRQFDFRSMVPLTELSNYLYSAKIGIIPLPDTPKFRKNIPSKLFDFILAGLPVVMSKLPPTQELVNNLTGVIQVPPSDIAKYSEVIFKLLKKPENLSKYSIQLKKTGFEQFIFENEEVKLVELYKKILN